MKKMILLSVLFSMTVYGADLGKRQHEYNRYLDERTAKKQRSELYYTNIIFVDKAGTRSKPYIIETPLFVSNQPSEDAMLSDQCWNFIENHIKDTFNINGELGSYHPAQCTFYTE
jgi:hypothetical protein